MYSTWTDPCNKNCGWSSITYQFLISHRSVKPTYQTGDRITWPQSGQYILQFSVFYLSILQMFTLCNKFERQSILFFTFGLFLTIHSSFYTTKLQSDRSPVIGHRSVSDQSVNGHPVARIGSGTVIDIQIQYNLLEFKCWLQIYPQRADWFEWIITHFRI